MDNKSWLIRQKVVERARANLGFKETEGNNAGKFIRALGAKDGDNWCAWFASHCYKRAYEIVGLDMPFERSPGAKRFCKNVGASRHGRIWKPGKGNVLPGDLVCWSRGVLGWQGHVGIVSDILPSVRGYQVFKYIAGNEGKDGEVKERLASTSHAKLWRFAGLR